MPFLSFFGLNLCAFLSCSLPWWSYREIIHVAGFFSFPFSFSFGQSDDEVGGDDSGCGNGESLSALCDLRYKPCYLHCLGSESSYVEPGLKCSCLFFPLCWNYLWPSLWTSVCGVWTQECHHRLYRRPRQATCFSHRRNPNLGVFVMGLDLDLWELAFHFISYFILLFFFSVSILDSSVVWRMI